MSRQIQHEVEVNSIVTNTATITIDIEKNVVTHKLMLRHNKELKVEFFVTTKEDYVATIKVVE